LSSAIVFGLSFATVLTLIVTPPMLMVFTRAKIQLGEHRSWWSRLFRRGKKNGAAAPENSGPVDEPGIAQPKAAG
jgi:multidrug efflux pump